MDEWMKNMWYLYTVEYYQAVKKILKSSHKRKEVEKNILSEVTQTQEVSC